jgi:rhodanese-related sulfurtransferase/rubrerythrin
MNPAASFQPLPSMTVGETRKFLQEKRPGDYNLVDVRQPMEYAQGHIPGARLIPLGELPARVRELDPAKPTVVYCRSGNRSGAGTSILLGAGLKTVFNMVGGMNAWNGLVAEGPPEAGMALFQGADSPEALIALAWSLEEGSRRFYAAALFSALEGDERHHEAALLALYRETTGNAGAMELPAALLPGAPGALMEGGVKVEEAIAWTRGKGPDDVLDMGIALESHALDLYLRMERTLAAEGARRVFRTLAGEEQAHLARMTKLLESRR